MNKKLTVDDIEVPEGMLDAYMLRRGYTRELEVVLLWLAENPIVPSEEDCNSLEEADNKMNGRSTMCMTTEWQRRMFLKRAPEVPAEVSLMTKGWGNLGSSAAAAIKEKILEAYEFGKAEGSAK